MKKTTSAIIIGAGIAGIATAIRLAAKGFSVQVFEKNSYPGGKLSHFEMEGYHFDAGPSLFTEPYLIEELFLLADEDIKKYFSYKPIPIACKYFYEDGTIVNAFTNSDVFSKELSDKLGESEDAVIKYLQESNQLYQLVGNIFLNFSLHKKATIFKASILKALKIVKAKHLFRTLHQLNQYHFNNKKTVQLFNRYATYNGSNPYKAPGMLSLIPSLEINNGTFFPSGGMIAITNALYQLAVNKGVIFNFNITVERIIENSGIAKGIVTDNKNYFSDLVITNMDAYFTYKHLLLNDSKASNILKQERSSSALIFYWGIQNEFPELELHNIFFSENYAAEFKAIFEDKTAYNDPTIYVNITGKCEPGIQAPKGKENWFVMINVPANIGQDWTEIKAIAKKNIIQKINRILKTDIESFIEVESVLDPIDIENKTASFMGSLYGSSSNSKMAAFLRHPNFSNATKGLYFVGGSVHPGGGIPLCLKSAKIAQDIIVKDFSKLRHL